MRSKRFIHPDFLLSNGYSRKLYHDYAEDLPIIDYHCHLPPAQVAEDTSFANMTRIWLAGDHYKWRAMRTNGVAERYCTGDASDWEKFQKWAETVPMTLRNPLYHWTHLELNRPFGISDRLLSPQTAKGIWDDCNAMLAQSQFSARGIMKQMKVVLVCTTDDPTDDLSHHKAIAEDQSFSIQVLPTFRPDKSMSPENPRLYKEYVDKLEKVAGMQIRTYDDLLCALDKRHEYFHDHGCRLSDHGLEVPISDPFSLEEVRNVFSQAQSGKAVSPEDARKLKSALMLEFGRMDFARNWTMQLHIGPIRNNSTRLYSQLGPDTGFDSIGDEPYAKPLSRFLDALDMDGKLPRTILYNINPAFNEVLATMCGNFQDGSLPGKIQFGSGWWFLDQMDGMQKQLDALSNLGLLSRFVGMLTDSRSLLSYTRHEYFRRILCDMLGQDVEKGILPRDVGMIGKLVKDICYGNASKYFGFGGLPGI